MSGTLYVVATPIGNLNDLTTRAAETLATVSLIAAEDTRHTGRLLMHIGCKTRLLALHDHNEERVLTRVIAVLQDGQSVALVSDAGTPLVSDPGFRLVREAHRNNIPVSPVVGASAVTAALSVAGLATDRFSFEGFLPAKAAARQAALQALKIERRTMVFYESVHRITECLNDIVAVFGGERAGFIGRELTKLHEQCVAAPLAVLQHQLESGDIVAKGEFVVIVEGDKSELQADATIDPLLLKLVEHLPPKKAAGIVAEVYGLKKNELYERLLLLRS